MEKRKPVDWSALFEGDDPTPPAKKMEALAAIKKHIDFDHEIFTLTAEMKEGKKHACYGPGEKEDLESTAAFCREIGIPDLSDVNLLDMGCGNKFVQAILNGGLPIKKYVGIDIHPGLIEHLQSNVTDDRFSFHVSNTHNNMYNPDGELAAIQVGAVTQEMIETYIQNYTK